MPLHLIKLCVGCDSIQDLEAWIAQKQKERKRKKLAPEHIHTTRMVPKRADELTTGGSLFWVIRGQVLCRERILAVRPFRAFQGWRYLIAKEAPRDLDRAAPGAAHMPEELRRELRELGLL